MAGFDELLKLIGPQQQPPYLPAPSPQDELRQRFMQNLGAQQPPQFIPQSATTPPGLPRPPLPREHARQQIEKLKQQAAQQVLDPSTQTREQGTTPEQLMTQTRARQGVSTMGPPRGMLEKVAGGVRDAYGAMFEPDPETGVVGGDVATGPAGMASRAMSKGLSKLPPRATKGWRDWRTAITDRVAPIHDLTSGAKLAAGEDPYVAARVFAGHYGKIQNKLDELSDTLSPFAKGLNPAKWSEKKQLRQAFKEHAVLDRMREQAKFGIDKFPGGATSLDLINRQKALEATLSPEQLKIIKDAEPKLVKHSNDVLREAYDSGLLTKKVYDNLTTKYSKYVPLHVIGGKLEAAQGAGVSGTLQVSKQDVLHAMTGSTKQVADPIESMIRNTYRIINQAERNRVARKVADLEKIPGVGDLVRPVKSDQLLTEGLDRISVWRDGKQQFYSVPEPVASAVKNMGKKDADLFTKWASKSSAALRAGATSVNMAFIPSNAVRDFMTAKVVSRGAGTKFTTLDWVGGLASALKKDDAYRSFLESGASFSGYNLYHQPMRTQAKQLMRSKPLDAALTITNPFKLINWVGQQVEYAPRIGAYKRAMKQGADPIESAFQSRNLTVDFSRAGNITKIANLWVPFLNARLQGTINVGNAFLNSKTPAAAAASASALIGIPTVYTYLHNTQRYPEIWRDIAQFEKDSNFLLIYGEQLDERGNPTQVLKLPKGDIGKVMAGPLEAFMEYMDGYDPKTMNALFTEMVSEISPIPFARDGKIDPSRIASSVTPPTLQAMGETVTGVNFFTGREIDPIGWTLEGVSPKERYYHDTPKWAVNLSGALAKYDVNISPLRIMNAMGTQFGGVGRQIADPERAGETVTRRFSGARGGEIERREMETLDQIITKAADESVKLERRAAEDWAKLKDPATPVTVKERLIASWESDPLIKNEIDKIIERDIRSPLERKLERSSVLERAIYIDDYLARLAPNQRGFVMARWESLGILTKETKKNLATIQQRRAGGVQ